MQAEFTENNIINWLKFFRELVPNEEDKQTITKFIVNHTDDRDDGTGKNIYASRRLYYKYWK